MFYKVTMSNVYYVDAEDIAEAKMKVLDNLVDSGGYNLIVTKVPVEGAE